MTTRAATSEVSPYLREQLLDAVRENESLRRMRDNLLSEVYKERVRALRIAGSTALVCAGLVSVACGVLYLLGVRLVIG